MRIGVDATCWWNRRGFGRFTRELLKAMLADPRDHQLCLFIDRPPEPEMRHSSVHIVQVPTSRTVTEAAVASDSRSLRDVWAFSRAVAAEPLDVVFFPAVYSWFPVISRVVTVVTLHDAIAEHYPQLIFPGWKGRLLWSLKMRLACRRARRLITVSHAAKQEIIEYIGVASHRIDVICEGADARFVPVADRQRCASVRARLGLPPDVRLIIYVGAIAPHKNLGNLLRGFAEALDRPGAEDIHLALVGDPAGDGFYSNYQQLLDQVRDDLRLRDRVHFTGFVSDDDLAPLYSDALAAVLPSVSEGFGLPALEAMACGTPVLTSNAGAAPEVVGEAGLTFDPFIPAEIARQIHRVASVPYIVTELRKKTVERAHGYTWRKAAELTFASLETCGGRR